MDSQTRWLQKAVLRAVGVRVLIAFGVAATLLQIAAMLRTSSLALSSLTVSIVLAQVIVGLWVAYYLVTNPLGGQYLERFGDGQDLSAQWNATLERPIPERHSALVRAVHQAVGSDAIVPTQVRSRGDTTIVTLESKDKRVVVVADFLTNPTADSSADPELSGLYCLSQLQDGRILYTGDLAVVPSCQLIVHQQPGAAPNRLLLGHLALMKKLSERGRGVLPTSADLYDRFLALEFKGLTDLGVSAGRFLSLEGPKRPYQLLVGVSHRELVAMGLRHKPDQGD